MRKTPNYFADTCVSGGGVSEPVLDRRFFEFYDLFVGGGVASYQSRWMATQLSRIADGRAQVSGDANYHDHPADRPVYWNGRTLALKDETAALRLAAEKILALGLHNSYEWILAPATTADENLEDRLNNELTIGLARALNDLYATLVNHYPSLGGASVSGPGSPPAQPRGGLEAPSPPTPDVLDRLKNVGEYDAANLIEFLEAELSHKDAEIATLRSALLGAAKVIQEPWPGSAGLAQAWRETAGVYE